MGFFSKLTCDTKESIPANCVIGHKHAGKPVYLLQPHGKSPIVDLDGYGGYGRINGVDWFTWLSETNLGVKKPSIGIFLDVGSYYSDESGRYYVCSMHLSADELRLALGLAPSDIVVAFPHYNTPVHQLNGLSVNDALDKGVVVERTPTVRYPIKLSFNPDAKYEDYPASEGCPYQGFFYD